MNRTRALRTILVALSAVWLALLVGVPTAISDQSSATKDDPKPMSRELQESTQPPPPPPPEEPNPKVPPGFEIELLFRVPEIEHPSVVTCDDHGNLFVGEDPMDMRGPTTEEFDRVSYIRWDPKGGPATKTVFCDKLSAVFGLIWHDGALYVMHAPHYSMFQDTDGDGIADVRKDLAEGFGPPAGIYGFNDHIVTGIRMGLDGLVYVSVGDKGIQKATGADGSTITLEGGGVVRMRLDGTQLEVVSSGTRNHLDVAMDRLDNIFTYDNTDDGLGWWTRFTHHVPTGYYGYPYDYLTHPDRHLPHASEHGGGSPCGADCYREAVWPEKYNDTPFFCEWGKGKIQCFHLRPQGATFTARIEDFMTREGGGEFRPVDLCFSPDGKHMYVADWNFSGWTQPKAAGRLFRVTYVGAPAGEISHPLPDDASLADCLVALDHPSHSRRVSAQRKITSFKREAAEPLVEVLTGASSPVAKLHALWAQNALMDVEPGYDPSGDWIRLLGDPNPDVRAQAARALGTRRMIVATSALERTLRDPDPTVRLQSAVALGRIGSRTSAPALFAALGETDPFARFTMIQAIRALGEWRPALSALRSPDPRVRSTTLLSLAGVYDEHAVAVLRQWAYEAPDADERAQSLASLGEVHRRSDPYKEGWWGTQPAKGKPTRPKKNEWPGTSAVLAALDEGLLSPVPSDRRAALRTLRDVAPHHSLARIESMVRADPDAEVRKEAIMLLAARPNPAIAPTLIALAMDGDFEEGLRLAAISALGDWKEVTAGKPLADLVASATSTPLILASMNALTILKPAEARGVIESRVSDSDAAVRAKAVEALALVASEGAIGTIADSLTDSDLAVRRAAARALGAIPSPDAVPPLIAATSDKELQFDVTKALVAHADRRALAPYLDGLTGKNPELRVACRLVLMKLRDEIAPDVIRLHERNELPAPARVELQSVFSAPAPITTWRIAGAWPKDQRPEFDAKEPPADDQRFHIGDREFGWKEISTADAQGRVDPADHVQPGDGVWALAYAPVESEVNAKAEAAFGSDDQLVVWVNGEQVYDFQGDRGYKADEATSRIPLKKGVNHVYVLTGNTSGPWSFSMQVSRRNPRFAFLYRNTPEKLEPAAYAEFAMKTNGDSARGKRLFNDLQGVACVKCHAVAGDGGKIGPDLIGLGGKYPRDEIIRSILEPSNRVLASYQVTNIVTVDGDVLSGIIKSETEDEIELASADGKITKIPAGDIESKNKSNVSLMPNGLKDGMTLEDFADIVAYMESLKDAPATTESATASTASEAGAGK